MKYVDLDIPAKLFFKILNTNDYYLLGFDTEAENKHAFEQIFDEYHALTQSGKLKNDIELKKQIALLNYKIEVIETTLYVLLNFPMTKDQRQDIIVNLHSIGVTITPENNMVEQINKIAEVSLGSMKTKLKILVDQYDKRSKTKEVKTTFEKMLVNIENVLNRTIDEAITMRKFLALQESANERVRQHKMKKK